MRKTVFILFAFAASILLLSTNLTSKSNVPSNEKATSKENKEDLVMTKEKQTDLSPNDILDDLLNGNERFVNGELTSRDLTAQVKAVTKGQHPKAVILSCIDSRVPVEYVFDQGIGDVFVARVAGNVEDAKMLGSLEYGLGVAGSKLLMVLGHESCGAVKSAIDNVDVGSKNVDALLDHLEEHIHLPEEHRSSEDKEFFETVVKNNVRHTLENIRERSPLIKDLEDQGKIKIVGAYYSLKDGSVSILDEKLEGYEIEHNAHTHTH